MRTMEIKNIGVFCASSNQLEKVFYKTAQALGTAIARQGWNLVYGGTNCGLMYEVAKTTMLHGGETIGILPECIRSRGVAANDLTQLIIASDMKERKELLRQHSDAFIAMPGGWGTLEEITEVVTLKQLGEHQKPIVFLNAGGYYNRFFEFMKESAEQGFVSPVYEGLYLVTEKVEEAIRYILHYQPSKTKPKYISKNII